MTVFYLIRHGDIVWAPGDPVLSKLGQTQAEGVGVFLQGKGVQRVYTSPLLRARQTAEIIAITVGAPLAVEARLRERLNWGDVPGLGWEVFAGEFKRGDLDRDYVGLGGVSARQAGERLAQFLEETARIYPEQAIAAVTHGGILGDYLIDHLPAEELGRLHPHWAERLTDVITHCSVTTLHWSETGPRLEGLAVTIDPQIL